MEVSSQSPAWSSQPPECLWVKGSNVLLRLGVLINWLLLPTSKVHWNPCLQCAPEVGSSSYLGLLASGVHQSQEFWWKERSGSSLLRDALKPLTGAPLKLGAPNKLPLWVLRVHGSEGLPYASKAGSPTQLMPDNTYNLRCDENPSQS